MWRDRIISTRALNYLRTIHAPAYVGLRFLLESSPDALDSRFISALVEQQCSSVAHRLHLTKRFKRFSDDGVAEYRDYAVPSPVHALCEAYVLKQLEEAGMREKRAYVYSYLPPLPSDGYRSFEFFANGYRRRNEGVLKAIGEDDVALIFDIKSFYPSVDARRTINGFLSNPRLKSLPTKAFRVVEYCANACVAGGDAGLRVGPELSHLLADSALADFDDQMSSQFRGRYFRYVDDLVFIVNKDHVATSRIFVHEALEKVGFKSNAGKECVADRSEWSGFQGENADSSERIDLFSSLKFRIRLFLSRNPAAFNELRDALLDAGVFLPMESFQQAASREVWQEKILRWVHFKWKVVLRYRNDRLGDIVEHARKCRSSLRLQLQMMTGRQQSTGLRWRWELQKIRFLASRALYLLPDDELRGLGDALRDKGELAETVAVMDALGAKNFGSVSVMPGAAAAAASQLAPLRGIGSDALFSSLIVDSSKPETLEVLLQFLIRGYELPSSIRALESGQEIRSLLDFACPKAGDVPYGESQSFGQELMWLGSRRAKADRRVAVASRLLPGERVVLEALSLSASYFS